ncbi:variable surface protein [Plasmodium gonderi]|uniref:Variable surface protein n=1 Tax=Plasmodium gonderi TaxID=77519 RepID=A0A1Y1JY53_PLAGO|nr:variable surface protein [Plasmodium gonderi]GAW84694.1 variable surface protein [Plasmodium gonderi]
MPEEILNIRELRKIYPFLHKVWELYESFDEYVDENRQNSKDTNHCKFITNYLGDDERKYKLFCMKLTRNLKKFCKNDLHYQHDPELCVNLNNWLYKYVKKENIDNTFIKNMLDTSKLVMPSSYNKNICQYYSYDEIYKEPINIITLNIFTSNMDAIKTTLKGDKNLIYCYCQKYVNEGVKIYKHMMGKYCSNGKSHDNKRTCDMLDSFKIAYDGYLYKETDIQNNIPSLYSNEALESIVCEKNDIKESPELIFANVLQTDDIKESSEFILDNDSTNSTQDTVYKVLATMAGISSILALLYKVNVIFILKYYQNIYKNIHFTPARNFFLQKNKKGARVFNTLKEEAESELFHQNLKDIDINKSNKKYKLLYDPAGNENMSMEMLFWHH